jgi:hypothetical protein
MKHRSYATPTRAPEMVAKGSNGRIEIDGDWLAIKRRGARGKLSRAMKGELRLAIGDIANVDYKVPGPVTDGSIRFSFGDRRKGRRRGLLGVRFDENSVMFGRSQAPDFEAIRDRVEAHVDRRA